MPQEPPDEPMTDGQLLPLVGFSELVVGRSYRPQATIRLPGVAQRAIEPTATIKVVSVSPNSRNAEVDITGLAGDVPGMRTDLKAQQIDALYLTEIAGGRRRPRKTRVRKTKRRQTRRKR